ncbi:hypothetical protein JR316_0002220 [Psilocybe cubensis]|uniref:Uncharacterized protein n=2 Tax=Psilocybe cubensis TaxID=181762 RepID=A0A8H8CQ33_PSICU|nr:hypothetical protein JR316_0002220 [Psilocybe cubensis]KAH9485312.1 hypothetical protein JR316_0002220 [Psilocybe cubensis]
MTSCQTWTPSSHIRHPWFDTTIMKRKHPETVSPDDDLPLGSGPGVSAAKPHPPKRRRCSNLEQGFAHMTLGPSPSIVAEQVSPVETLPTVREIQMASADADMTPLASTSTSHYSTDRPPYTIEEPSSAPEVKMKNSSWYELGPDRIIITDMDSFAQEDEEENETISVNTALLDRIRSNTLEASSSSSKSPATGPSQALILFKPLVAPEDKEDMKKMQEEEEERRRKQAEAKAAAEMEMLKREGETIDEDAMDVEP